MYDNYLRIVDVFSTIIYARLSKEEIGKSKEEQSKSIKNQIEICKKYIEEEQERYPKCKYNIVAILKDDGISGTTFERKDFKKLLNLIEDKKANMVITTDLSRLGRNHIKTDDFIEEWFPEHNVRYVSIIESVDTYTDCISNDIAPIINWSNEHFAKLTSKKIKSRFQLLRLEGKWTGGEPPYGYKLDKNIKYHFIVDETNAEVVRRIFKMFLEGKTLSLIADILTKEGVPIPSISKGYKRRIDANVGEYWKETTIKNILKNEVYCGYMIQGKTTRLNHKSKKTIYLPKDDWIKIRNAHEAIVSEETFSRVQSLLKSERYKFKNSYNYLLKGLMKCSECNHAIGVQHFNKREKNYTICNYYRKYGSKKKVCTAHRFIYEEVEELVLKRIYEEYLKYIDINSILEKVKKKLNDKPNGHLEEKISDCKKDISELEKELDILYEDKLKGIIYLEQYERLYTSKMGNLKGLKFRLNSLIEEQKNTKWNDADLLKAIKKIVLKPNKSLISSIIDVIKIDEKGDIEIYYKICSPKIRKENYEKN